MTNVWRELRTVRDTATFGITQVNADEAWVLAKVKPDTDSYRARVVGAHIDQTGKVVQGPGVSVRTVITVSGSLSTVAVLSGVPP